MTRRTHLTLRRSLAIGATLASMVFLALPIAGVAAEAMISLDAENTSAQAALEVIASKAGLNLVTSPEVRETKVTLHLSGVKVDDAISLVTRAAGLSFERLGNSLVVGPAGKISDGSANTVVISVQHANVTTLAALIGDLGAKVHADPVTSRLIVNAPLGVLEQIQALVKTLDVPGRQVELRARLIEVNEASAKAFGLDWQKLMSFTTILTEGIPGAVKSATTGQTSSGAELEIDQLPQKLGFRNLSSWGKIARQSEAWKVTLDALIQNGNAKIISDVKLSTVSDQPATVHVGDVVPYIVTGPPTTGGVISYSVERQNTGVSLKIIPKITASGEILTTIEPTVSSIVGFRGPDASLPQTKERSATTQVSVKDGETIVIAGLQQDETTETVDKVPLLGDIPLLGKLFQHYKKNVTKTNLVIEVTPHILP